MSGIQFNINSGTENLYPTQDKQTSESLPKRVLQVVQPSVDPELKSVMSRDSISKKRKTEKDAEYYFTLYSTIADETKARKYLEKACDLDHPQALYELGITYYECPQASDLSKAIHYLEKSAELNFVPAKVILGFIYHSEPSIVLNENVVHKIVTLWTEAAEADDMNALLYLGILYRMGELIPRDFHKARHLLIAAAEQGSPEAKFHIGMIHLEDPQVADSDYLAFICFTHAALRGHIAALHQLGVMCEEGIGTDLNIENAITWYQAAANAEYPAALHRLGEIYCHGLNVNQDIPKGTKFLWLAATQGHADSQLALGIIYRDSGRIDLAIKLLSIAAKKGLEEAQFELGDIYEMAKDYKDLSRAYFWYAQAAKRGHEEAIARMAPKRIVSRPSKTV